MNSKALGVGVVIVLLLGAIVGWLVATSRGRARDFLDPMGPVFTGPLPPPGGPINRRSRDRFSVVSFNVHFGYARGDIAPTLR
ncbi:MAG: hypothetical protein JJE39_02960, partial [Vicinamibacteria bacterium]|nr:hypothetical protein [Vicinamibacteria bacterium]